MTAKRWECETCGLTLENGESAHAHLIATRHYVKSINENEQAIRAEERVAFLAAIEEERRRWWVDYGPHSAVQMALDRLAARFSGEGKS